jgi:hypothetical protein
LLGFASILIAADRFVGTWKLDPARSTGTVPKGETVVIQQHGAILTVEVSVLNLGPDKPTLFIRYSAPKNGGMGNVDEGPYNSVSIKRISAHAMEITYFADDKEVRSTRAVVAKDGQTMTSTGKVSGSREPVGWVMFFEKQRVATR